MYGRPKPTTTTPPANSPKISRCGPLVKFLDPIRLTFWQVIDRMGARTSMEDGCYDVVDCETTGTNPAEAVIWQLSSIRLRNWRITEKFDEVISISREDYDNAFPGTTPEKKAELYEKMHMSWDRISAGRPLNEVLTAFGEFRARGQGVPLLGHNLRKFDIPMLKSAAMGLDDKPTLNIDPVKCLDTGMIVKAAQDGCELINLETHTQFFDRVAAMRLSRIYWSLEYITEQLGLNVAADKLHDSLTDCVVLAKFVNHVLE